MKHHFHDFDESEVLFESGTVDRSRRTGDNPHETAPPPLALLPCRRSPHPPRSPPPSNPPGRSVSS